MDEISWVKGEAPVCLDNGCKEVLSNTYLHLILTWGPVNVGPIGDLLIGALALTPAVWGHQGAGGGLGAGH